MEKSTFTDYEIGLVSGQATQRKRGHSSRLALAVFVALCFFAGIGWLLLDHEVSLSRLANPQALKRASGPLNILVIGDWGRRGEYNQSRVAEQMGQLGEKLNIDFVISTGDNFYENGLTSTADPAFDESFSNIYTAKSLQKTWYSVLGNHDYRGNALAQFDPSLRQRDSRWQCERSFSLVYELGSLTGENSSSVQFFFIDTTPFVTQYWERSKKQHYDWRGITPRDQYLNKQLQDLSEALKASKASWKIVVGHHPIRSVGVHGDTVELVQKVYPILKENDVHLYINGHDHCLQHISSQDNRLQFLTSGGGSKAWRGIHPIPNKDGLHFYYDGQGFMTMSISSLRIHVSFLDALGNTLYDLPVLKNSK